MSREDVSFFKFILDCIERISLNSRMAEKFVNDPGTTLASGCSAADATITVTNSSGYPTSGNFRIKIDLELMLVTAVSGVTWTVTRGIESTTATVHLSGAAINHTVTAGGLITGFSESTQIGTYASLPSPPRSGTLYMCTDSAYSFVSDGTNWHAYYSGYPVTVPPVLSTFTQQNGGSAADQTGGGILFTAPYSSGHELRVWDIAVPSTPYTIDIGMVVWISTGGFVGLTWRDGTATSSKQVCFGMAAEETPAAINYLAYNKFSNTSSYNSGYSVLTLSNQGFSPLWFRVKDDGTNFSIYWSTDNINWVQMDTNKSRTDFLSSVVRVGVFIDAYSGTSSSTTTIAKLIHWKQS
jgi:hypothetical protein